MKIALVTHKVMRGDGQGRVNYEVAWAALRRGHMVVLLASQIAPELESHPNALWVRIPVVRWPTELLCNQVFAWRSLRWLRRHGRDLDVVHANGCITWAASDVNSAHFVHATWLRSPVHTARLHRSPYGFYQWLYSSLNARWEKVAYHRAKTVVAVSEPIRDELVGLGVPNERIRVITNGVDLREFSLGTVDRREMGLPEGVPLALFVGDIRTPRKNLDTVLGALEAVPGLHLAVVGVADGSPYPRLAARLGLLPRVHFLGYRRDLPRLMRAADMFVFPSRYEALPLVLLEAMASGLPIVTAVTAGAVGLVDEECGVVLDDPNDTVALTAALELLTRHEASRVRMGRAARTVAERHGWQKMGEEYLRLYEEIVGNSEAARGGREFVVEPGRAS